MEEHVDDGYTGTQQLNPDRIVQHVWGLRYIDDLVLNRVDANANGSYTDSSDFTHYALTDHQFSVIAMIDGGANLIERVSYTPYGEARHHWKQDVDGDGDIDATDQSAVTAALNNRIYESGYNVDADFDRNGIIDSNDSRQIGSGAFRAALPAGWISSLTTGNVIGFSGYVFNREIDAGGLYTVRFRHYDPVWGRWISRDPIGYSDGMSLYSYVRGAPVAFVDPMGLLAGAINLRDPELRNDPYIKPVADALHESARETRILLEQILEWEMFILKELAIAIATGGAVNIIGKAAAAVLVKFGPQAMATLAKLGKGAYEGMEQTILGGIIVVWIGGQWVIKKIVTEAALIAAEAGAKRKAIKKAAETAIGAAEGYFTPPDGPPMLPIPSPWYVGGWVGGTCAAEYFD